MNAEKLNMTYEEISKKKTDYRRMEQKQKIGGERQTCQTRPKWVSMSMAEKLGVVEKWSTPLPSALTPTYNDGTAPQEEEATVETR